MDLAISYVNETAANNDKVEHVPGVAEVVLRGDRSSQREREREGERERDRQREREKEERRKEISGGGSLALTLISAIAMSMREPRTMTKSKLFQGSPK